MRGRFLVAGGAGAVLATALATAVWLGAWPRAGVNAIGPAEGGAPSRAGPVAAAAAAAAGPFTADERRAEAGAGARSAPRLTAPASTAPLALPITVVATPKLRVGDMGELVISLGANAAVGEVSVTVQFDANVLQARAGIEGNWAASASGSARFAAQISDAEDRVQMGTMVSGVRLAAAATAGSLALVQFQAVAPGSTWVMVSNVTVKDRAGNALPFVLSSSHLHVTAESLPPPRPNGTRHHGPAATAAPAPEGIDTGG